MDQLKPDLSSYDPSSFSPGRGTLVRTAWFIANALFLFNPLNPLSGLKIFLLRLFGAKIGCGVVLKPRLNVKYPWNLEVGDHVWIGEGVWIDNLVRVSIGSHVCISQAAMLLTGNHNYKKSSFDLITGPIVLEDGVWIGAQSLVTLGVTCGRQSVLTVKSVATNNLDACGIYRGNPAVKIRQRVLTP